MPDAPDAGDAAPAALAARRRTERLVVWDGVFSRLMDAFTSGVFLAGVGLLAGMDNFTLGILAALPFFAQVAQLPAVAWLMRTRDRRRIVVATALAARLGLVAMAALLHFDAVRVATILPVLVAMTVLAVVSGAGWNTWMREAIEPGRLGRFFAFRMQVTTTIGALGVLGAGFFVDGWAAQGREADAYALVFLAGAVAGLLSCAILQRTPQPPPETASIRSGRTAWAMVTGVLRERANRPVLAGLCAVSVAMAVALPFTAIFLLRSAGLTILEVAALALASQLAYVVALRIWGRLSDTHGNRPVLQISTALLAVALVGWGGAIGQGAGLYAYLAVLHVLAGVAVAGLELTIGNLLYKTAPATGAAAYLAAFSLARSAAAGVAAVLAGWLWQTIGTGPVVALPGTPLALRGFHVLALVSAAVALVGLVALRRIPEPGVAPVPVVVRAMRREVQSMSTVAGVRAFAHAASYVVELMRGKRLARTEPTRVEAAKR